MRKIVAISLMAFLIIILLSFTPLFWVVHTNVETHDLELTKRIKLYHYASAIDYRSERVHHFNPPSVTLLWGGDCEDISLVLFLLLKIANTDDVAFVHGKYNGNGHYWVESHGTLYDPQEVLHKTPNMPINMMDMN